MVVAQGSNRLGRWGLWAVAAVGLAIRSRQFLSGRSLWLDEAMVANDLRERTIVGLVSSESPREQMAPPGFWVVEKAASIASHSAASLRFFPFVGGVLLLALAVIFAQHHLRHWPARILLVATISFSPALVHYSTELKPYVVEAAASMLLMLAVARRRQWSVAALTAIGVGAILFSFPALVFVPLLGVAFGLELASSEGWSRAIERLWRPAIVLSAAEALVGISALSTRAPIDDFWHEADGYAPAPWSGGFGWLAETAARTARFSLYHVGIIGRPADDSLDNAVWASTAALLVALVLLAGILTARRWLRSGLDDTGRSFVLMGGTIAVAFAVMVTLSGLELYPLQGRLTIYLFPLVFLAAAASVDYLMEQRAAPIVAALALVVALAPIPRATDVAVSPYDRYDIVEALSWIEGSPQPGDAIVFDLGTSGEAFAFHSPDFDFGATPIRHYSKLDADGIAPLADGHTVWYFSAFVTARNSAWVEQLVLDELVVDHWRGDGAVAIEIHPMGG